MLVFEWGVGKSLQIIQKNSNDNIFLAVHGHGGVVSEWLRRKIRNLLGFTRAGSNPVDTDPFWYSYDKKIPNQGLLCHKN